ncbi:MAG: hypothetical protein EOP90_06045 [Lysobacteraceae bacterium]|nr:MAG: hypothetical protein EOP90_06045 [Xanthomonadaceae bacterium]
MQTPAIRHRTGWRRAPLLLALVVAPLVHAGGDFVATGDMGTPRALYGVAPLQDGRVLFVGGIADFGVILAEVEAYEPWTGSFTSVGFALVPRMRPSVVALQDGRILIAGGRGGPKAEALASAELFDPPAFTFSATGSLTEPHYEPAAALLDDGRVLIAGGYAGRDPIATADVYDPATGVFTPTGNLNVARIQSTGVTRLADGRILIVGGWGAKLPLASAEIYDPATGQFSLAGEMPEGRALHALVTLADGRVLVVGGSGEPGSNGFPTYHATALLYDPATETFAPTGDLAYPRDQAAASLLPDGRVLVAGGSRIEGNPGSVAVPIAEIYDPASGTFSDAGTMLTPSYDAHPATLPDGSILLAGGWQFAGDTVGDMPGAGAERFVPRQDDVLFADGFDVPPR